MPTNDRVFLRHGDKKLKMELSVIGGIKNDIRHLISTIRCEIIGNLEV